MSASRRAAGRAVLAAACALAAGGAAYGGDAQADAARGKALFDVRCGICHAAGGTGTFMLGRRLGVERALLAQRTDLTSTLVETVVRRGINGMPVFTRVELTDAELALVAAYLARPAAARAGGQADER
jgi:mono/diheme cytochrome c family protein